MANPYLLPALELGPLAIQRLISLMPPDRYDVSLNDGRFTVREGIAHLADWEPILLDRLKVIRYQPGGVIQGYDEGQRAIDQDYASWDPAKSAELFIARRKETIDFIRNDAPGHWQNTGVHSERGELSLEDLANTIIGHDTYHLEHLTRFLAL